MIPIKPDKDNRSSHLKVMVTLTRTVWVVKAKLQWVQELEVWTRVGTPLGSLTQKKGRERLTAGGVAGGRGCDMEKA